VASVNNVWFWTSCRLVDIFLEKYHIIHEPSADGGSIIYSPPTKVYTYIKKTIGNTAVGFKIGLGMG
jgi:hypothetical protein